MTCSQVVVRAGCGGAGLGTREQPSRGQGGREGSPSVPGVCWGLRKSHSCLAPHPRNVLELIEFFEEEDRFYLVFEKMRGGTWGLGDRSAGS